MRAGAGGGAALPEHRPGPAGDGSAAARYRKDLRAELRAGIFVLERRATDRAHLDRHADGGREAAGAGRFSAATAVAGGAYDSEPPRAARIRVAQAAHVPRSDNAALPGRFGLQDGV